MDAVLLVQMNLPSPVKFLAKLEEIFFYLKSSSTVEFIIQYEAPQMNPYLPYSLSGTPNAENSNCL